MGPYRQKLQAFLKKRVLGVGLVGGFIFGFLSLLFFLPDQFSPPDQMRDQIWPEENGSNEKWWQPSKSTKSYTVKIKRKPMRLTPLRFRDIPQWQTDDHLAALKAFRISCTHYLNNQQTSAGAKRTRANRKRMAICQRALKTTAITNKQTARQFFEQNFRPARVQSASSLFTGYYEPVIEGSKTKTSEFTIPVYRRPPDLVSLIQESHRAAKNHQLTFMRKTGKKLEPFPTRKAIENGALEGQGLELVYLKDQVDSFFMHIQGSGRIKLQDGSFMRIGYDGKNGHPYRSIGQHLKNDYKFTGSQLRLEEVKRWLRENNDLGKKVMWHNKSYIFFKQQDEILTKTGPIGAEGVSLTPERSLAVDGSYHQLGMPIWLDVPNLNHHGGRGFHHLMIGQDVGSAIKGPVRGDIYWGSGEAAGLVAGGTKHKGRFIMLLPR